jgi:hypothetical protein
MQPPVLTEKTRIPTWETVAPHIGASAPLWRSLFDQIHREYPDVVEEWRYYTDGRCWLLKVTRKAKTLFWLSVVQGSFRTTFYFTEKAVEAISKSGIASDLKRQFASGKPAGRLRGITIVYRSRRDVDDARRLIALKIAMK